MMMIPKTLHEERARKREILQVSTTRIQILFGLPQQPTLVEIPANTGIQLFFEALGYRCLEVPPQPADALILVQGHEYTGTSLSNTDFDWWKLVINQDWVAVGSPQYGLLRERTSSTCSTAATLTPYS